MMGCTDRHFRYFLRLISKHTVLYTEMRTTRAVLQGDAARFLNFHASEHPLALQLGGSDPEELAHCTQLAEQVGYDEININVGCPSDRVQSGKFGACLMAEPELVARCVETISQSANLPVTVKTRIGIDYLDSYQFLLRFVSSVASAGCRTFIIHARKAWLSGLSPKQNLEVPTLRYDRVHRLKQDFPQLEIVLNGGVRSLHEAEFQLAHVDGVMLGREIYNNPYILAEVDGRFYGNPTIPPSRQEVLNRDLYYVEKQCSQGVPLSRIVRHVMGLFQGLPGARAWRRSLSKNVTRPGAGVEVIEQAARYSSES